MTGGGFRMTHVVISNAVRNLNSYLRGVYTEHFDSLSTGSTNVLAMTIFNMLLSYRIAVISFLLFPIEKPNNQPQ
jgi:hypothetical protein